MNKELIKAAQAVVDRWDSTDWKAAPTAEVMNGLRNALAELSRREKVKAAKCVCGIKGRNDALICAGSFEQYLGTPNEYCGNLNINGYLCGHDRACHGGESD
jgi:hypothetical protein